ncbi:MAG: hypothetical protein V4697_03745 [Patescibacteria group bacterium]
MATLFKKKYQVAPGMSLTKSIKEIGKNPFVDWILILLVSLGISIFLITSGVRLYFKVVSGDIKGSSDEETGGTYRPFNQKALSSAIELVKIKESATSRARGGYSGPGDPSF